MSNVAMRILAEQQAEICRVLGNPTRIMILWTVAEGERPVSEIAQAVNASLQSTSQHLHLMKRRQILTSRRDGHMVYYRLNKDARTRCQLVLEAAKKRSP